MKVKRQLSAKAQRIVRTVLMSKSHFSRAYEVSHNTIDKLIAANKLPVEYIDDTDYIIISDNDAIMNALRPVEYIY